MSNHLSYIEIKDFLKLYKDYTTEVYSFLVNDMTLPSDKLRFRNKLFHKKIEQNKTQYNLDRLTAKILFSHQEVLSNINF